MMTSALSRSDSAAPDSDASGNIVEAMLADHLSLALQNQILTERLSAYQADTDEQFAMGDARVEIAPACHQGTSVRHASIRASGR